MMLQNSVSETGMKLSGFKILVLEDDPIIALDVEMSLQDYGADVVHCLSPEEALEAMTQHVFNCAVLDVNLGKNKTCADVAVRLKENGIPFILHSGDLRRRGELIEEIGAPVVVKPSSDEQLVNCLVDHLIQTGHLSA